jgi:hypothetical protein
VSVIAAAQCSAVPSSPSVRAVRGCNWKTIASLAFAFRSASRAGATRALDETEKARAAALFPIGDQRTARREIEVSGSRSTATGIGISGAGRFRRASARRLATADCHEDHDQQRAQGKRVRHG